MVIDMPVYLNAIEKVVSLLEMSSFGLCGCLMLTKM